MFLKGINVSKDFKTQKRFQPAMFCYENHVIKANVLYMTEMQYFQSFTNDFQ